MNNFDDKSSESLSVYEKHPEVELFSSEDEANRFVTEMAMREARRIMTGEIKAKRFNSADEMFSELEDA